MVSDLKSDLVMTSPQRRPNVHLDLATHLKGGFLVSPQMIPLGNYVVGLEIEMGLARRQFWKPTRFE